MLDYCNWALKVHGMSSDSNLVGDHPWLGGTSYGTVDSPAGPSMATIDSPARPSIVAKFAVDCPAGQVMGGTIGGVKVHAHMCALCACLCSSARK